MSESRNDPSDASSGSGSGGTSYGDTPYGRPSFEKQDSGQGQAQYGQTDQYGAPAQYGTQYGQPGQYGQAGQYGQPGPYGPPGYATPGYGTPAQGMPAYGTPGQGMPQQPYGPPPYGPMPGYAPAPTNTMAILALVFAFVFAPVAIVLGVMARKEIARTGEQGHGLATAGMWLGIVFTALMVLFIAAYIVLIVVAIGAAGSVPT